MRKTIRLIIALAIVMTATSACKTKQKIAEVPAGANVQATKQNVVTNATANVSAATSETIASEPEVTRNENFSLVDGESSALKYKYHVVVGSFSKQENARGLQKTLKSEGNNALIVVNEKGMYRVLIASFNDYNQAHSRIKQIAGRFADAWVLVQR
jgi:Sporulation related domain.